MTCFKKPVSYGYHEHNFTHPRHIADVKERYESWLKMWSKN